jgi:lipopolysaccharide heptosyltransferase II
MKIRLLKLLDNYLGKLAIPLASKFSVRAANVPHKFLVIRPGGIGDAVLLLPALMTLKRVFPQASIDVLAEIRNAGVFPLYPAIERVYRYDKPGDLIAVLRTRYDVVIDTEQWHRLSALVARLTRAPLLIGFATNNRARLFTHPVAYSHDDFETDSFYRLLQPILGEPPAQVHEPYCTIPAAADAKAATLLGELAGKAFVAIFPGASIQEKRWGVERFVALADCFAKMGIPLVILGGKSEAHAGDKILGGESGKNLTGETTLAESVAVISKAAVLVSGDSGLLHLAACLGRPTVSLFGPSNTRKWAPKGEQHVTIARHLPCVPCSKFGYTPKCPVNVRCMAEISVEEVAAAVAMLLKRLDKPSAYSS